MFAAGFLAGVGSVSSFRFRMVGLCVVVSEVDAQAEVELGLVGSAAVVERVAPVRGHYGHHWIVTGRSVILSIRPMRKHRVSLFFLFPDWGVSFM